MSSNPAGDRQKFICKKILPGGFQFESLGRLLRGLDGPLLCQLLFIFKSIWAPCANEIASTHTYVRGFAEQ